MQPKTNPQEQREPVTNKTTSKTYLFVIIQFTSLFFIIIPFSTIKHPLLGFIIVFVGLVIGFLALSKNRLGNFNIRPDIKEAGCLITDGIYRYIRHPMYTSVLLSAFGTSIVYNELFHWIIFGVLFVNMILKMLHEEKLWHCHDAAYKVYAAKTKRLVPYLF